MKYYFTCYSYCTDNYHYTAPFTYTSKHYLHYIGPSEVTKKSYSQQTLPSTSLLRYCHLYSVPSVNTMIEY